MLWRRTRASRSTAPDNSRHEVQTATERWQRWAPPGVPMASEAPTAAGIDQQALVLLGAVQWDGCLQGQDLGTRRGLSQLRQQTPSLSAGCFLSCPDCQTVYILAQAAPSVDDETRRRQHKDSLGYHGALSTPTRQGRRVFCSPGQQHRTESQTHLWEVPLRLFFTFPRQGLRAWVRRQTEGSGPLDGCTLQARGRNKPSHAAASSQVEPGNPPEGLQLGQIATPDQIITALTESSEASPQPPLQAQSTASEMGSLPLQDPEPLTARAVQGVEQAVGTAIAQSGVPTDATSPTSLDSPTSSTGTVEDLGCHEPGLPKHDDSHLAYLLITTGPDPPPLSPSSIDSAVFQEGLNRLHSFQDLARLRLKHATQIECYETTVLQLPETTSSGQLYHLRDRRWAHLDLTDDEGGDDLGADLSGTGSPLSSSPPASTSISTSTSTSPDRPSSAERRPFSLEAFFDASTESPEGSPTLPRRDQPRHTTYRPMPPKTMPELSGLGDSSDGSAFLSSTWASSSGGIPTDPYHHSLHAHLRPRSAPKNLSRTSNPFTGLWNRKGQQHQPHHDDVPVGMLGEAGVDPGVPWKRISDDGTAVEVHEGRTTPPRSASGAPNGLKDAKEPANTSEGGGPPPLTREEYEALPLAIQRKVCWLFVKTHQNPPPQDKTKKDMGRGRFSPFSYLILSLPARCPQPKHRAASQRDGASFFSCRVTTGPSFAPARQHLLGAPVPTFQWPAAGIPVDWSRSPPAQTHTNAHRAYHPIVGSPPHPFHFPSRHFWFQGDVHPIGRRRSRAA